MTPAEHATMDTVTSLSESAASVSPLDPPGRGPRKHRTRTFAVVLGVPVLVALLVYVGLLLLRPHPYSGTVMQAPTPAPSMADLVGIDGEPIDLAAFRGDLVVLYFGYTFCPDVCPTTLAMAARAREQLGGDADRVHVMMVSVDPERDDVDRVRAYVQAFDPSFLGATGSLADIEQVAATYGVFFAEGEPLGDGYAVDHTATLMAIDIEGKLRIVWSPNVTADALADDLRELL
jgi:protein SCO1